MKKKVLELTESEAIEFHKESGPKMKSILENNFGKKLFYRDICERLGDYQDCLKETGNPDAKTVSEIPEKYHPFLLAIYANIVVTEAYNEGEVLDIFDSNVKRYFPVFSCNGSPSRFAFGCSLFGRSDAFAGSGSRLSLKEQRLSDDYARKFKDKILEMLTK